MLKLVIQVLTKFLLYTKAGGVKPFKLFLFSALIIVLNIVIFTVSSSTALAVTGDYNKDITNNTLSTSEWNLLDDDFVDADGDTMTGNLNIFRSSGDNAELQLESVSGNHWGLYHDRTSNDLRFWNLSNLFSFTDSGSFGIGTTNPSRLFSVVSNLANQGMELRAPNPALWFVDNTTANKTWSIYNQGSDNGLAFRSENDDGSGRNTRLFLEHSTGYVGIGTVTPSTGLDVQAGATYSIKAGSKRIGDLGSPVLGTDAVTRDYVDTNFAPLTGAGYWELGGNVLSAKEYFGSTSNFGLGFKTNDLERMTITNTGNIGIGTDNPGSLLTIANDNWVSAVNSTGTGYVNMFKVNSNNQLELGTAINAGTFEFAPDSGFNTFVDMAVTSAPTAGTVEGYSLKLDGNNILSIYSEADGSGGIQNEAVGIGTATPSSKLTLSDGDFEMTNNKSIKIQNATANTTLLIGNYADGGGFSYGTNYTASLAVEGDVKGNRICIGEDCKSTWSGIVSGGMPAGTPGQTLRYDTSDWVASSVIYNDGTNVGIGTAVPSSELDVYGDTSAQMFFDRDNTNYYLDPAANVMSHSAIFAGNVGIGTTNPVKNLEVFGSNPSLRIGNNRNITTTLWSGEEIASIEFYSYDPSAPHVVGKIQSIGDEASSGGVAAGALAFYSNGDTLERMRISSIGNVGIGANAPLKKLHVRGTGDTDVLITADGSYGTVAGLKFQPVNVGTNNYIKGGVFFERAAIGEGNALYGGGSLHLAVDTASDTMNVDVSDAKLTVDYNGKVGIGTTDPLSGLHIQSSDSDALTLHRNSVTDNDAVSLNFKITQNPSAINSAYIRALRNPGEGGDASLIFGTYGDGETMRIKNGNVGIGSTAPQANLDVAGQIRVGSYGGDANAVPKSYIDTNFAPITGGVGSAFVQGGNSFGTTATLGTNDTQSLAFETVGATRMTIDTGGNVAIGTTSASYLLDVAGTIRSTGFGTALRVAGGNSDVPIFRVDAGAGQSDSSNYGFSLKYMGLRSGNANSLSLFSDNISGEQIEAVTIFQDGNVGIGSTSPSATLDVAGEIKVGSYGGDNQAVPKSYIDGVASKWNLSGDDIYNNNSGNVGIGTSSPTKMLEVAGDTLIATTSSQQPFKTNQATYLNFSIDYPSSPSIYTTQINFGLLGRLQYDGNGGIMTMQNRSTQVGSAMIFVMGSTESLRIRNDGFVGIGSTTPQANLDVAGQIRVGSYGGDANAVPKSYIDTNFAPITGGVGSAFVQGGNSFGTTATLGTNDTQSLAFETVGATRMTIDTSGNVGIGTATIGSELDIYGDVSASMYYDRDNTNYYIDPAANVMSHSAVFAGNVGIGTTSPASILDISFPLGGSNGITIDTNDEVYSIWSNSNLGGLAINANSVGDTTRYDLFVREATGNIGIGTNAPDKKLTISQSSDSSGLIIYGYDDQSTEYLDFNISAAGYQYINSSGPIWFNQDLYLFQPSGNARFLVGDTSSTGQWGGFRWQSSDDSISFGHSGSSSNARNIVVNSNGTILMNSGITGNVGIGTTSPARRLSVSPVSSISIDAMTGRIENVGTPINPADAVTMSYVESSISGGTYWEASGDDIYNNNAGNVGIGIGTTAPGSLLTIANDSWVSSLNSAGTGYVNMFKVNSNNQLEFGTAINAGNFEFAPDSGLNTFVDMAVTSASAPGTVQGYSMQIDTNNILTIYSEADGSGGIQNEAVGIGTNSPSSKLTIHEGDLEMTNNKSIKIEDAGANTTLLVGNYADGSGFTYGGNYTASLAVEGDVKGNRICIGEDCMSSWSDIVSGGIADGTSGQTLRHDGTDWVANSNLFNNGTDVGIGTAVPGTELDVYGDLSAQTFFDRDNTNYYLDPAGNLMPYSAIFNKSVGIGTTSPTEKLQVAGIGKFGVESTTQGEIHIANSSGAALFKIKNINGDPELSVNSVNNRYLNIVNENVSQTLGLTVEGSVGIGTTNPTQKLQVESGTTDSVARFVSSDSKAEILIKDIDAFSYWGTQSNKSYFGMTSGLSSNNLIIDATGNVGIGTASPGAKLAIEQAQTTNTTTFSSPHLKLTSSSGTTDLIGTTAITLSTSVADNYGISLAGLRATTGGAPDFSIRTHNNSAEGVERLRIKSTGFVGIGSTDPQATLDVAGQIRVGSYGGDDNAVPKSYIDNGFAPIGSGAGSAFVQGGNSFGTTAILGTNDTQSLAFETVGATRMTIDTSGNVGIGTATIGSELDVYGDISASMYYDRDNTNYYIDPAANVMSHSAIFAGNVGIGTTSPKASLSISKGSYPLNLEQINAAGDAFIGHNTYYSDGYIHSGLKNKWNTTHSNFGSRGIGFSYTSGMVFYTDRIATTAGVEYTPVERMRITNEGEIGIGTPNPLNTLHVYSDSGAQNSQVAFFEGGQSDGDESEILVGANNTSAQAAILGFNYDAVGDADYGYLELKDRTKAITFNASGNVGVGTIEPMRKLSVVTSEDGDGLLIRRNAAVENVYSDIRFSLTTSSTYTGNTFIRAYRRTSSTDNDLLFHVGGSDTVMMKNSGFVGIGSTDPQATLDVAGQIRVGSYGGDDNAVPKSYIDNGFAPIGSGAGSAFVQGGNSFGTTAILGTNDTQSLAFETVGATRMTIDTSGNVGIGTATIGSELDVYGDISASMYYDRDNTNYYIDPAANVMSHSAVFAGNVGIGTTSPSAKLDIETTLGVDNTQLELRDSSVNVGYNFEIGDTGISGLAAKNLVIRGDSAASDIAFSPSSDTPGALVIKDGGNVGIGTTNPSAKLHVNGNVTMGRLGIGTLSFVSAQAFIQPDSDSLDGLLMFTNRSGYTGNLLEIRNSNVANADYNLIDASTSNGGVPQFRIRGDGLAYFAGNVGIGTTSPARRLSVSPVSSISIDAMTGRIENVGTPINPADAVNLSYVESSISGSTFWAANGDDIYNSNVGNVGIGIGTTAPGSLLTIANDNWVTALNSTGTGYVNMFKVNSNNQLELGTAINAGTFEFAPDSGFNTFVDMAVTAAPAVGTIQGYTLKLDGNNILSLYSEADGSGGIQNQGVGIGTAIPSSELDVYGDASAQMFFDRDNTNYYLDPAANLMSHSAIFAGNVGIGTLSPSAKLHVVGNAVISGTLSTQTGSDFAEEFVVSDYIEPGTVVVMGDLGYKSVKVSSKAYDSSVVGVVSDNPSIIAGKVDSEKKAIIAMVGVVSVKVVDEGGSIRRGDLLTSSSVSGHARKADKYVGGTIIGKALEDLEGRKGIVKVLVNLQ
jgi:hypothetical protein